MAGRNLQTYAFDIADGTGLCFAQNDKRGFFAIQNLDQQELRVWIGANPTSDPTDWFKMNSALNSNHIIFEQGLQGPIYMAEILGGGGKVVILSDIIEEPTVGTP